MSHPLGTYSFLPWLRRGLANQIQSPDFDASVLVRASVDVGLVLKGVELSGGERTEAVNRPIALFGPGDIVGIERRSIVRFEPRDWITNFEPNYLAHIEFYDEDLPWRYTPAAPDGTTGRLRPWIMLVVLTESEFTEGRDIRSKPLGYVDVPDVSVFPPADQLWAWAHVHVNRSLAANDSEFTSNDMNAVLPRFQSVLTENPDLACSRIVCPRKLAENEAYHVFLMPVFETGRLAGLGLDPAESPHATFGSWVPYSSGTKSAPQSFPYYVRWYFRTGKAGDFEALVRLLKPQPVDNRVGSRAMDLQVPGANLRGIDDKPELKGILKLGGALRVPRFNFQGAELAELLKYENWATPFPRPIQEDIATLIDLADDYAEAAADAANAAADIPNPEQPTENDPDPLITPPLYGMWHARTKRLLHERNGSAIVPNDNWVHELNLDPRFRAPAGFGTRVIQDQQEKYMDAAWEQIGDVIAANRRIRLAQLAREVSFAWHETHFKPLLAVSQQKTLLMVAPLNKRLMASRITVHQTLLNSLVQPAMTSPALRRIIRPRARLVNLLPFDNSNPLDNLINRVNEGQVSAAPPKVTPPGIVTVDELGDAIGPQGQSPALTDFLRRYPWILWFIWLLALLLALLAFLLLAPAVALTIAAVLFTVAFVVWRMLKRVSDGIRASDAVHEAGQTPEAIDDLPTHSDFVLSEIGSGFIPQSGGADSVEAGRLKTALKDSYILINASEQAAVVPPKTKLDLGVLIGGMVNQINPNFTIPRRIMTAIFLPPRIRAEIGEQFVEAMAYPEIDIPMYEPLKKLSAELFLPNINLIEQNSITLLETNQKFIEAYMVGLNHEFARELLWREYPTDQRGSYFRQFWDVSSFFNSEGLNAAALKEKLRDIPRLDRWSKFSALGEHDNRQPPGSTPRAEVVLVIRGELLKRYPTAVIYAHRACWQRHGPEPVPPTHPCQRSGAIDNTKERRLAPLTLAEEGNPPRAKVRTPLYEAKVDPDIYFFGFDLTVEEASGGTGENPTDDPGWFFVIKERPGEPRFGLDSDQQPDLNVWNDLSWADVQPGSAGSYIQIDNATPTLSLVLPTGDEDEKLEQHQDDRRITWSKNMNSADLAYTLFQAPVLVAVHAAEMLPK
jgi:hypothetical protein